MKKLKTSIVALKYPNITFNPKGKKSKRNYITPKLFEQHLLWLLDWRYSPISSEHFKQFLFNELEVPMKSFLILLEGGYKNFKQYAFPILKRYKMPALIFLVANHVGDYDRWDTGKEELLSIDDIFELNQTTMITFGSQSKTNKNLIKSSEEELTDEIVRSKHLLEEILRYKVEFFNYPYNKYNPEVIEKLYEAEIAMAFIEKNSQVTELKSFQEIPCIKMCQKDHFLRFLHKIRSLETDVQ